MRWLGTHSRSYDRGAIATIVAILFMGGVLLALAALTIDVGSINAERRTLQNGADAAAMSVARTCVDTKTCPAYDDSALIQLVNSNDAKDHHTKIARVDGKAPVCGVITSDPNLPACEPLQPGLSDCPMPATLPAQYIRVYTQTQNSAGQTDTILPPIFGQTVVAGYNGVTQQTCASVGVGSLGGSPNALPIVIAQCAYDAMMAKNTPSFPLMPPTPAAKQSVPISDDLPLSPSDYSKYATQLLTHTVGGPDSNDPMKCDKSQSGQFIAGGFGWTDTVDGTHCAANFTRDSGLWTMPVNNGAATPDGCKNNGQSFLSFVGTVTYIPILTGISADGNSYIIDGLAGFYVAGYRAPAAHAPNNWDGYKTTGATRASAFAVKSPDVGFWGWFVDDFVPVGSFGTTQYPRGLTVLGNIG